MLHVVAPHRFREQTKVHFEAEQNQALRTWMGEVKILREKHTAALLQASDLALV